MKIYALCINVKDGEGYDTEDIISYHLSIPEISGDKTTTDNYGNIIPRYFVKEIEVID